MRRDRHKFYLEAFSLMAPITWQGSTPASNRRPKILREEKGSSAASARHLPAVGEVFACASKAMAMHGVKSRTFPLLACAGCFRKIGLNFKAIVISRCVHLFEIPCMGFPAHPSSASPLLGTSGLDLLPAQHGWSSWDALDPPSPVQTGHEQEILQPCRPPRHLWLHGPSSDPRKPQELMQRVGERSEVWLRPGAVAGRGFGGV